MVHLGGGVADTRGASSRPVFGSTWGREVDESRGSNGESKIDDYVFNRSGWTLPSTNGRKRT